MSAQADVCRFVVYWLQLSPAVFGLNAAASGHWMLTVVLRFEQRVEIGLYCTPKRGVLSVWVAWQESHHLSLASGSSPQGPFCFKRLPLEQLINGKKSAASIAILMNPNVS
jgi:hypothetical protein